jgi:hypothetical protein
VGSHLLLHQHHDTTHRGRTALPVKSHPEHPDKPLRLSRATLSGSSVASWRETRIRPPRSPPWEGPYVITEVLRPSDNELKAIGDRFFANARDIK